MTGLIKRQRKGRNPFSVFFIPVVAITCRFDNPMETDSPNPYLCEFTNASEFIVCFYN